MSLRKAERKKSKLRIMLAAPSGGGKTYSSLLIAYGITGDWNKIAIIDTENGSADLYEDLGPYNVFTLRADFTPEKYIAAIEECEKAGMEVIIIDSMSHEWAGKGGCLDIVDAVTKRMRTPNSYTAWNEVTPRHQAFLDKIVSSEAHIIATVRSKQDYIQTEGPDGKKRIEKVGMAQITRDGAEYEFTVSFELDMAHMGYSSKDRTGIFAGEAKEKIGIETGKKLREWSESGKDNTAEQEAMYGKFLAEITVCSTITQLVEVAKKIKDSELDEIRRARLKSFYEQKKNSIEEVKTFEDEEEENQ